MLHRGARGCLVGVVAIIAVGWFVAANFRPLGDSGESPHPISIASRWASRDVVLTPARPDTTLRVTFTYSGDAANNFEPAAVTTAPRENVPTGGSAWTLDPRFALVEPAVSMDVVQGASRGRACAAPCEQSLMPAACASACVSTFDIRLSLVDPAARDAVAVTLRAGATGFGGSPLPGNLEVKIEPVESPVAIADGSGSQ